MAVDQGFARGGSVGGYGETTGGFVSQALSPSNGKQVDDVPARLNEGEYVIPRDVVHWRGKEFFHKLIAQSRKMRQQHGAPTDDRGYNFGGPVQGDSGNPGDAPGTTYDIRGTGYDPSGQEIKREREFQDEGGIKVYDAWEGGPNPGAADFGWSGAPGNRPSRGGYRSTYTKDGGWSRPVSEVPGGISGRRRVGDPGALPGELLSSIEPPDGYNFGGPVRGDGSGFNLGGAI